MALALRLGVVGPKQRRSGPDEAVLPPCRPRDARYGGDGLPTLVHEPLRLGGDDTCFRSEYPRITDRPHHAHLDEIVELGRGETGSAEQVVSTERLAPSTPGLAPARRSVRRGLPALPQGELRLDDLEGEEVISLLLQDEAEPRQVLLIELAIPTVGPTGIDQPL